MEFAHVKPQTDTSVRESATLRTFVINDDENSSKFGGFGRDEDAHYAASKYEEQVARNDRGSERIVVLEVDLKDDLKQNSKKSEEDTEAFGAEKNHFENENRPKSRKEKDIKAKKQNIYKAENDRQETRNAAGHRNVYHKNGFEKDFDFYNNGRQSGEFDKHDRYGEKHAIAEDTYAKDKSNSSRLVEIEAKERGKFEKMRAD